MGSTPIYGCTTDTCPDRFRGFTDEATWCSTCMFTLTEIANPTGASLEELNAMAARAPRPHPEGLPHDGTLYVGDPVLAPDNAGHWFRGVIDSIGRPNRKGIRHAQVRLGRGFTIYMRCPVDELRRRV